MSMKLYNINVKDIERLGMAGSQFPELDNYGDVYARAGNDAAIALHAEMLKKNESYLEEIASHTSDDCTPIPDRDVGLHIMTETLGVRRGREIRGMGAGRVCDLSAGTSSSQSSQPSSEEFVTLSNEVQQLKTRLQDANKSNTEMRKMFSQLARIVPGFVIPESIRDESMPDSFPGADDQ